jgi:hypothetical protein
MRVPPLRLRGVATCDVMFRSPSHLAAEHYGEPGDLARIASSAAATRAAIDALDRRDSDLAYRLWESVDGISLLEMWERWNAVGSAVGPKWDTSLAPPVGEPTRGVSVGLARRIYERDGHRCRYCGIDVFARSSGSPIVRLVEAFPDLTPLLRASDGTLTGSGKSGTIRNVDYSKFLWSMAAPDHIFPRALGGPTDESNLVTACWGCNGWKNNFTLDQLGVQAPK